MPSPAPYNPGRRGGTTAHFFMANISYSEFGIIHDRSGNIVNEKLTPKSEEIAKTRRISETSILEMAEAIRYKEAVDEEKRERKALLAAGIKPSKKIDPFLDQLASVLDQPHHSWWRDKENHRWLKQCNTCGKALPLSEFGRYKNAADFLRRYCKQCWTIACLKSFKDIV